MLKHPLWLLANVWCGLSYMFVMRGEGAYAIFTAMAALTTVAFFLESRPSSPIS